MVEDTGKALESLAKLFDVALPPSSSPLGKFYRVNGSEGEGIKWALIPVGGPGHTMLETVEPTKDGYAKEFLRANGNMSVLEICFRVDDIEKFHDKLKEMGITPTDFLGNPLTESKFVLAEIPGVPKESWPKFFYLKVSLKPNQGVNLEIVEYPPSFPR